MSDEAQSNLDEPIPKIGPCLICGNVITRRQGTSIKVQAQCVEGSDGNLILFGGYAHAACADGAPKPKTIPTPKALECGPGAVHQFDGKACLKCGASLKAVEDETYAECGFRLSFCKRLP